MSKIGLRAARVNAGYTLSEVSEAVGISKYTLAQYEKGFTVPRWDVFQKLCELYKFSVNDIVLPER